MKLKVGQELWWVPFNVCGNPKTVKIVKLTRAFATLDIFGSNGRLIKIDASSLVEKTGCYNSVGSCYLSKQDYELHMLTHQLWINFRDILYYTIAPPEGVTLADIEQARKLLRL